MGLLRLRALGVSGSIGFYDTKVSHRHWSIQLKLQVYALIVTLKGEDLRGLLGLGLGKPEGY